MHGCDGREQSAGSALPASIVQRGQIFTTLRNACGAMLTTTCPHLVPIAFHGACGKPGFCLDKKLPPFETIAMRGSQGLVHTKPPSLSTCGVENPGRVRGNECPPRWASTGYGVHEQQGPPVAGLVVHVLQYGVPYSALPPNLWVYCRLMVRPTLSNQDTS